ncbi:MAG: sugar phosphate isomerase/epimerase [Planctomycetota bacterium]|nr:sugar phosphate isomerase/epimerase [Planctomycetota bacterium]
MKPGITQLCLKRQNLDEDLRRTKELGYEAIELVFGEDGQPGIDATAQDLQQVKKACGALGLEICSLIATRKDAGSLLSPKKEEREKRVAILRRGLEIASALGVNGMLLHPGQLEATDTYERAWNDCVAALKGLAPAAEKHGCAIAIENVWNKFILSPREGRQFADEVGSPWVGIYLDTANLIHYGFTEVWIRDLKHRIKKVHVKDYKRRPPEWTQLMDGDCNWPEIMKELRAIGFDGALVSEVGGDDDRMRETALRIRKIMAL